ncbi:MAG: LPS assembly lipoprotein LptE [Bacteroidota bacterium]
MQKSILGLFLFCVLLLTSCGVYTHSGASVPPDAKTFSVAFIQNTASIVAPTLSQTLTEKLKQKFINETSLKLTQEDGDFAFSGKITDYKVAPAAVQGNQANAVNRLTVSIEITFESKKDETKNFKEVFSRNADFDASLGLASEEPRLITEVTAMLVQDVFNKAFINW